TDKFQIRNQSQDIQGAGPDSAASRFTERRGDRMTEKLELSIALSRNENTEPILQGHISPEAIKLHATPMHPSEMFWRQLKFAEFDVSEMSMSSLTIATSQGRTQWVGLPVFTTREFFHNRILIRVA